MNALFSLAGRKVLVTGASSGLGRHFAITLTRAGAQVVVVAARRTERLRDLVAEIDALGGKGYPVSLDVTSATSVRECFDLIGRHIGTIDVLVNNAGVSEVKPVLRLEEREWDAVVDTNLKGAWLVAQEAARRMVAASVGGSIVNIASILGERVIGGLAPYCASKAGLVHLTKSMAMELARYRIRVNALSPGYIATEMNRDFLAGEAGQKLVARIPQQRFGQPQHLDGPLLLLASEAGTYMSGAVITVDGGHVVTSI
jgi:NAD(P)-dependent dehydrogenase (short-subunit alcohol dehydrogenase family)